MSQTCTECTKQFEITPEDLEFYKKFNVQPASLCFDCDQIQRLCYRNERSLYLRKCDATGDMVVSIFSPDKPYKIYKSDYWYSDKWDPLEYGQDFDFNRPFFEQYGELLLKVPRLALANVNAFNSDYCNSCYGNKNSYMIMGGDNNEDCMYGTLCMKNTQSVDLDYSNQNEVCYMLGDSMNCYGCQYTFDSKNCNNCYFVSDCISCSECILSSNLVNKSYCINNVQYSKEEYFEKKKELMNGSYLQQQKNFTAFLEMLKKRKVKYVHMVSSENCNGDYLKNCKNCHMVFDVAASQDLRNVIFASSCKDAFNCSLLGDNTEFCYNSVSVSENFNVRYSFCVLTGTDVEYGNFILNCQNIFGCTGLRQKKYCIFNKQYSKEEYEALREKIITHMKKTGEYEKFPPRNLSCFGYNETTAHDYYPLTKEQAVKKGYHWKDEDEKNYQPQTYKIPDDIQDISDSITGEILECEMCHKNFKITTQELKFYHKMNIPIPRNCCDCRHKQRMSIRNPRKLWNRKCEKCQAPLQTTYDPDRPEKVYCESCYLKEVY